MGMTEDTVVEEADSATTEGHLAATVNLSVHAMEVATMIMTSLAMIVMVTAESAIRTLTTTMTPGSDEDTDDVVIKVYPGLILSFPTCVQIHQHFTVGKSAPEETTTRLGCTLLQSGTFFNGMTGEATRYVLSFPCRLEAWVRGIAASHKPMCDESCSEQKLLQPRGSAHHMPTTQTQR